MFRSCQVIVTDKEQSGHPSASTTQSSIEQIHALILNYRRVTVNEVTNHLQLVMVLPMKSLMTDFTSIKFVQDGFQNNS
jgi:hypothetical protein